MGERAWNVVFIHRQESGRAKKLRLPSPSASARAYSSDHERHCFGPHNKPSAAGRLSPAPKCCLGSTSIFAATFTAPSGVAIARGSAKPSKRRRNPGCLVESGGGDDLFPSPIVAAVATHAVHSASRAAQSTLHLALLACKQDRVVVIVRGGNVAGTSGVSAIVLDACCDKA